MKKFYTILANVTLSLHILFADFLLLGWLFSGLAIFHRLALVLWIGSWLFLGHCPLSNLEFFFRKKSGVDIQPKTDAIYYYVKKTTGKELSSRHVYVGGLIVLVLLSAASYAKNGMLY